MYMSFNTESTIMEESCISKFFADNCGFLTYGVIGVCYWSQIKPLLHNTVYCIDAMEKRPSSFTIMYIGIYGQEGIGKYFQRYAYKLAQRRAAV
ncbi:hypothetical protein MAR_001303 [Mya arenaria]|uniref:Uncharacterized protein n=1 Tax=Mya arenaria TaxID=6604 RepID=A0ABY7FBF2_MYAAR|nr:hypothetical protein MAR_001303 [Mya arenaria]